jgi:predicted thioesterase
MKLVFQVGDVKEFEHRVVQADIAEFSSGVVHEVYSTFALARDAEWCCRLFVLEMKESHEEGIGTMITVNHHSPAKLGQSVNFVAEVKEIVGNSIICSFEARVGNRLVASGEQEQKILPKEKIDRIFAAL